MLEARALALLPRPVGCCARNVFGAARISSLEELLTIRLHLKFNTVPRESVYYKRNMAPSVNLRQSSARIFTHKEATSQQLCPAT